MGRKLIVLSAMETVSDPLASDSGSFDSVSSGSNSAKVAGSDSGFSLGRRMVMGVLASGLGKVVIDTRSAPVTSFSDASKIPAWQRANKKKVTAIETASLAILWWLWVRRRKAIVYIETDSVDWADSRR